MGWGQVEVARKHLPVAVSQQLEPLVTAGQVLWQSVSVLHEGVQVGGGAESLVPESGVVEGGAASGAASFADVPSASGTSSDEAQAPRKTTVVRERA